MAAGAPAPEKALVPSMLTCTAEPETRSENVAHVASGNLAEVFKNCPA